VIWAISSIVQPARARDVTAVSRKSGRAAAINDSGDEIYRQHGTVSFSAGAADRSASRIAGF
jgi:hypothetical protein